MVKKRPPLLGYNHNVRHGGQTFHVQTEDSGVGRTCLTTHVFLQGVIVATARTRYEEQEGEAEVLRRMQEQHKSMLRQLRAGAFDGQVPALTQGVAAAAVEQATHQAPQSLVGQLLQRLDEPGATVATTAPYATKSRGSSPTPLSDAELAELVDLAAGTLEGGFTPSGHSGAMSIQDEDGPVLELVAEPPSEEELLLDLQAAQGPAPAQGPTSAQTPTRGSRPPQAPAGEGKKAPPQAPEGAPPLPAVPTRVRLIPAPPQSSPGVTGRALRTTAQRLDAVGVRARGTAEGVVMKRPHLVGEGGPTRPTEVAPMSSRHGTDPKLPMPTGDERSLDQLVLAYLAEDPDKKK